MNRIGCALLALTFTLGGFAGEVATTHGGDETASSLVRRGVELVEAKKFNEAIATLSRVCDDSSASPQLRADALRNRATAKGETGASESQIHDLSTAMALEGLTQETRTRLQLERAIAHAALGHNSEAMADYAAVIDTPGATPEQRAAAFYDRAIVKGRLQDAEGELRDYGDAIAVPGIPAKLLVNCLFNRATVWMQREQFDQAAADFSKLLEMPAVPGDIRSQALTHRGRCHAQLNKMDLAFVDLQNAAAIGDASPDSRMSASTVYALLKYNVHDWAAAAAAYDEAFRITGASDAKRAIALIGRAQLRLTTGNAAGAVADCEAATDLCAPESDSGKLLAKTLAEAKARVATTRP